HVVDKSTDGYILWNPRVRLDALDLAAHVAGQIAEGMKVTRSECRGPPFAFQPFEQIGVLERLHPAVGVIDDHELLGAQQVVRNQQRTHRILSDDSAGVADDMSVAGLEPEK